jgi:lipopolysaccharide export LptBFGC system permease protein LptF
MPLLTTLSHSGTAAEVTIAELRLEWAFGYPLVLAVMALICLALYRAFRRNGWL